MKRILTIAIVLLCAATSAFSQTLTATDRDRALQYLESTKQGVLDATAGFPKRNGTSSPHPTGGQSPK
jgi:hypothetical protein